MAKTRTTKGPGRPPKAREQAPDAPKRGPGRPPKASTQPLPPVTGIRFPVELLARVDAFVARRNVELEGEGFTTNRNAVVVRLVRDALDAIEGPST